MEKIQVLKKHCTFETNTLFKPTIVKYNFKSWTADEVLVVEFPENKQHLHLSI